MSSGNVCDFNKFKDTFASHVYFLADVIGAFSKLELYQLYFSSAGVEYACNALRTDPLPIEEFDTVVVVKQWKLVSGVQVRLLVLDFMIP